jgi:hypothetical protein
MKHPVYADPALTFRKSYTAIVFNMVNIIRTCTKYKTPLTFITTPFLSALSSPTNKDLKKKIFGVTSQN